MLSQLNNLNPEVALQPFRAELGEHYGKIVADVKSMLGRVEQKELITTQTGWKISAKCKLTSKDGYAIQLPLNNAAAILLRFGMQLNELADAGKFEVHANIPKECQAWIEQHKQNKRDKSNEIKSIPA